MYGPFVHPAWSTDLLVYRPGVFEAYAKHPPSVYSYLLNFYFPLGRLAEQHLQPPFTFVYTINNEFTGYTVLLRDESEKNRRKLGSVMGRTKRTPRKQYRHLTQTPQAFLNDKIVPPSLDSDARYPRPSAYIMYHANELAYVRNHDCRCKLGRLFTCSWCATQLCDVHMAFSMVPGTRDVHLVSCPNCLAIPVAAEVVSGMFPLALFGQAYATAWAMKHPLPREIEYNLAHLGYFTEFWNKMQTTEVLE